MSEAVVCVSVRVYGGLKSIKIQVCLYRPIHLQQPFLYLFWNIFFAWQCCKPQFRLKQAKMWQQVIRRCSRIQQLIVRRSVSMKKRQNRCSVAAYNKITRTCFLSNDSHQDLLDANEEFGVLLYFDPAGMFSYELNIALTTQNESCEQKTNSLQHYLTCTKRCKHNL